MAKECECPEDHSVAKLGHNRDCDHYRHEQVTMIKCVLLLPGCPPRHADGTAHDFGWATYSDEQIGTGVCYCGLHEIDHDLFFMP